MAVHRAMAATALILGVAAGLNQTGTRLAAAEPPFWGINTWPNGAVPFRFATTDDTDHDGNPAVVMPAATRQLVLDEMANWSNAVRAPDPADATRRLSYLRFAFCGPSCGSKAHVVFRMNSAGEDNNMCTYFVDTRDGREERVGRNPAGVTQFHIDSNVGRNTIRHELGHCLGLWHEQNREDRDAWLHEKPDADGSHDWKTFFDIEVPVREPKLMPLLGSYDVDSIMHYKSRDTDGRLRWSDARDNEFDRSSLNTTSLYGVSPRDVSRVMQYYARQAQPRWGFFEPLATPAADPDQRPNPLLAGVRPVGTPAIAWQSEGNYDVFSLGADRRIYWKSFRRRWVQRLFELPHWESATGPWTSLGCCFASDPAAVSSRYGHVVVAAIGADTGRPLVTRLDVETWGDWRYASAELPSELAEDSGGRRIGPAVASRASGSLDVFVVLRSGNLAVSTQVDGQWTGWTELEATVDVTARPAAVAASATEVRLAVNADVNRLYEPLVTFDPWNLNPAVAFGRQQATMASRTPPALAARADVAQSYRVLIVHAEGRVAHKFQGGGWWDVGGIPRRGSGITAVGDGAFGALIVMHGEDAVACALTCPGAANAGKYVQDGGIWMRRFY